MQQLSDSATKFWAVVKFSCYNVHVLRETLRLGDRIFFSYFLERLQSEVVNNHYTYYTGI